MTPIRKSLTRQAVRAVDQRAIAEYGLPGLVLMENAGRSAAEWLAGQPGVSGGVAIICGKGNNAGDGFVIARHLENRGFPVQVLLASPPENLTGDAGVFHQVLIRAGTPVRPFSPAGLLAIGAEWIVDALLGTGLTGPVRDDLAEVINSINDSGRRVFAVDLPSGLDCDTGLPTGPCIRADHTGTFVARKRGFDNPASQTWTGTVHVLDIGVPCRLLDELIDQSPEQHQP